MKKAEVKATGEVRINPNIAPTEKVEIAGIESALDVAINTYKAAALEYAKFTEMQGAINKKDAEWVNKINALHREITKTEGVYKRSSKRETLEELHNYSVNLQKEMKSTIEKKRWLDRCSYRFNEARTDAYNAKRKAQAEVTKAATEAGYKFIAAIKTTTGKIKKYVRTATQAAGMVYQYAEVLLSWDIWTVDGRCCPAFGYKFGEDTQSRLENFIDKYDEKYIDAEFSETTTAKGEVTISDDEEGFKTIVIRSIHNFTLGKYTESIDELKNFVAKASGELRTKALAELQEWINIARTEGVEVEDYAEDTKATEETIETDLSAMFGQPEKTSYQDLRTKIQVSYRTGKNGRESKIWAMYRIDLRTRHEEFIKVDQATAKRILEENGWTVKDFVKADKADKKAQAKATVAESITEDDGSNDEPEEDFLATLDTSVDEDAEDDELVDEPEPNSDNITEVKPAEKWHYCGYDYHCIPYYLWNHKFIYGGEITITSPEDLRFYSVDFQIRDNNKISVFFSLIAKVWRLEEAANIADSKFWSRAESAITAKREELGGKLGNWRGMMIEDNFDAYFKTKEAAFEYADFAIEYLTTELAKVDAAILQHFTSQNIDAADAEEKAEDCAVTPEDDGSNDEPEAATQADIAAADSVPTFTPETLARPKRQYFVYGFHALHFLTTDVIDIIKTEKSLKYSQGRINGLKKRFAQGKIDADNYALDMIKHQRWVEKDIDDIAFFEKEIINHLPAAVAELPELEKFVKHYEPNGAGDYCNMLAAAKFAISYAQNVAADIATPAVEVEVQAEIDNATVQAVTGMYNLPTANDIAKAVLIMKMCAKRGGFFILQIAQFAIKDLRKPLETQTAEISEKNILPAKQEAIEPATNIYDTASIADIAKAYFLAQGKKYFKDDAKTISYFKTVLQIKSLVVLGVQVEEKIQENLKPSNYYYNIYDAECRMAEDCRCLTAVKRSFARKAKHHQTLANKAWKEHQKYFLEVFCGAAMYDQIEKSILYLCDTLGELEKSPSVETVTIDIQADEISNEIAPAKVDSEKGNLPTAEEYFDANDISSWKFGAVPRIQRDTQDNILKVESFGELYINHKKWITEYKQERADLAAGRITKKDLKYEDVPDFCNGEIFKPDEFLKEDYDALYESVAKLTANIAELEKAIAVLKNSDNAEYNKRAEVMIDCLNKARDILATYKAILKGEDAQTTAKVSAGDDAQKYLENPAVEKSGYNKFDGSKANLREWISEVAEDKFKAAITAR